MPHEKATSAEGEACRRTDQQKKQSLLLLGRKTETRLTKASAGEQIRFAIHGSRNRVAEGEPSRQQQTIANSFTTRINTAVRSSHRHRSCHRQQPPTATHQHTPGPLRARDAPGLVRSLAWGAKCLLFWFYRSGRTCSPYLPAPLLVVLVEPGRASLRRIPPGSPASYLVLVVVLVATVSGGRGEEGLIRWSPHRIHSTNQSTSFRDGVVGYPGGTGKRRNGTLAQTRCTSRRRTLER